MWNGILVIFFLILCSAFFSMAEISLAASRKMKLKVLLDNGNIKASQVLDFQDQPGMFFTTVQIGLNAVAILAGIVGDSFLTPPIASLLVTFIPLFWATKIAAVISFSMVTASFIFFADLMPKRISMSFPEPVALQLMGPMKKIILVFSPLSRSFNALANIVLSVLGLSEKRRDDVTSDDLYAIMEAGTLSGVLRKQEKELIGNVFELESRTIPSVMTMRENIVYFERGESEESIKEKITAYPHSTYLVCEQDIDHVVGYVDSKELLERVLKGQSLFLDKNMQIRSPLVIPDTLTLAEAMDQFKGKGEDLAVVLNEYALVVGIICLKDVMMMLMGTPLVGEEEQIIKRDDHSWLIEGATPIEDIMQVFGIEGFPASENYETIGGFMTFMLRRIPHRTDSVSFEGYKFEVMDIDNYKIDQILLTKIEEKGRKEETSLESQ